MVFESRTSFDIGSMIELGFHITWRSGEASGESRTPVQEFITGQGMVVGCRFCASEDGRPVHEVTLLFSAITERDKLALSRFSRMERRGAFHAPPQDAPDQALLALN